MNTFKSNGSQLPRFAQIATFSSQRVTVALERVGRKLPLHLAMVALVLQTGCAQMSLPTTQAAPLASTKDRDATQQVDYAGSSAANRDVSIAILRSILPGDDNYFPKTKDWAEYVFELKTFGVPIAIQSASIVTKEGAPLPLARSGYELLEPPKVAQAVAKNTAVMSGAAVGGMLLGTAIPFIGPILMAGAQVYTMKSMMSEDDKLGYEKTFREKAGLNLSHIESNARIVRSVYFPMVPEARSIVVEYKKGVGFNEWGRVEIPLRRGGTAPSPTGALAPEAAVATVSVTGEPSGARTLEMTTAASSSQMSIKEAQEALSRLGYNVGSPDGVAGKRTVDALRRFQATAGLPTSGRLDPDTVTALKR